MTCRPIIFGAIGFANTGALGGRAGELVDPLWEVGLDRSVVLRLGRLKRQVLDSQLEQPPSTSSARQSFRQLRISPPNPCPGCSAQDKPRPSRTFRPRTRFVEAKQEDCRGYSRCYAHSVRACLAEVGANSQINLIKTLALDCGQSPFMRLRQRPSVSQSHMIRPGLPAPE